MDEIVVRPSFAAAADRSSADEEQRLLRAAQEGDTLAFAALVAGHLPKVASVSRRFLRDPDDAEDAVQETLIRAYRGLRRFRGEASVRTWLLRIAVNVCKNQRGEFWRRRVELAEDLSRLDEAAADSQECARSLAEAAMTRDDRDRQLRRALQELPEQLRLPILLHFYEELSGAEIAAVGGGDPRPGCAVEPPVSGSCDACER
jgi:RNA polymerase sigma-70 factor (ECF subfamily)